MMVWEHAKTWPLQVVTVCVFVCERETDKQRLVNQDGYNQVEKTGGRAVQLGLVVG